MENCPYTQVKLIENKSSERINKIMNTYIFDVIMWIGEKSSSLVLYKKNVLPKCDINFKYVNAFL